MGLQTIQRNYGFTHNSETMTNSDLELIAISSNQEKVSVSPSGMSDSLQPHGM